MNGFINVLKPPGMTSHDVVSFLRRTLGIQKIGHTGTLDPQAAGVLPVCVGQATRLAEYLSGSEKEYLCRLTFGLTTTTQDAWGQVVARRQHPRLSLEELEAVLPMYRGEILQTVPMYSAVKIEGIPLYKLARQGKSARPVQRKVIISELRLLEYSPPEAALLIKCSKGTYVRTLCHDIGQSLGTGGIMSFLLRTKAGSFHLYDSMTIENIAHLKAAAVLPIEKKLLNLEALVLSGEELLKLRQGQRIKLPEKDCARLHDFSGEVTVWSDAGKLQALAVLVPANDCCYIKPKKVFDLE